MIYIPEDERKVTDSQVFDAFDMDYPGLEPVKEALSKNDPDKAKKELAAYFHRRTNVSYLIDYRGLPLRPIDGQEIPYIFQASVGTREDLKLFCLEAGRKMMENVYVLPGNKSQPVELGKEFESAPHFNCSTDFGKHSRTPANMFTRGQWMEYLFFLYHETRERAVVEKFRECLYFFWKNYPLLIEDKGKEANRFQYTEDRTVMSVGWLANIYLELLYTELPYEAGEEVVFDILKHLWFLTVQFRRFDRDGYRPYNHHLWERGLMPFIFGVMFPEIPAFRAMKDPGAKVICRHVKEDFNTHGGYNEHSMGYWSGAALGEMLYRGVSLARLNKEPLLDQDARRRIDRSFQALAAIAPPTDYYPSIGDSGGPVVDTVLRLGMAMTGQKQCGELLKSRRGEKADLREIPLYYSDDQVGFVCGRTGFGREATYMLMSAKVNCGHSGHNHMDMLSVNIAVRGKALITEPYARYLYPRVRTGSRERGYHYNMTCHNTVLAYGNPAAPDEMYADQYGNFRPDSPVTSFQTYPEGMAAEAAHNGYMYCSHRRQVLFGASGNMVVRDQVWPGRRVARSHIQRWHLAPGWDCIRQGDSSLLAEREGVRVLLVWDRVEQIRLWKNEELLCREMYRDREELGWIIDGEFRGVDEDSVEQAGSGVSLAMIDVTEAETGGLERTAEAAAGLLKIRDERQCLEALDNILPIK